MNQRLKVAARSKGKGAVRDNYELRKMQYEFKRIDTNDELPAGRDFHNHGATTRGKQHEH
jgi:hypothetical protein